MSLHPVGSPGHGRTLTSMLSPIPSEDSPAPAPFPAGSTLTSVDDLMRSHSVPAASAASLHPHVISASLESTHAAEMSMPQLLHASSLPSASEKDLLKSFDPLSSLSPPAPQHSLAGPHAAALHSQLTVGKHEAMHPAPLSTSTSANATHTTSVSSFSSSALSSGSFTAISVSPVPNEIPPLGHNHSASVGSGGVVRSISVDLLSLAPSAASAPVDPATLSLAVAHLSIQTPSAGGSPTDMPRIHEMDSTRSNARSNVRFSDSEHRLSQTHSSGHGSNADLFSPSASMVRLHEEPDGGSPSPSPAFHSHAHEVHAGAAAAAVAASQIPSAAVASPSDVALVSLLSPSYPQHASSAADSPRADSPLPPVVSALMAAQKVAGTTPGATLAMPVESRSGRLIFIVGDASGAGKSSVAMGLLHLLLKRGYEPKDLAYIKPCTQCEDVQIISKYCESKGIAHQGIGPVIFYEGFTAEVIDGKTESVDARRGRIQKAVQTIAEGRKWVLVDGVGYAAVGSVAGVSNAEVASLLNAPVLVVGRPGIGNAIDSMSFIMAYLEKYHVHMVGACWNKVPPQHSYHSYEKCKQYVTKYFREVRHGIISTYGHIPLVTLKSASAAAAAPATVGGASDMPAPAASTLSCRLRPAKADLVLTAEESEFIAEFIAAMEAEFDIELLLGDLNKYYSQHRVQLVSVV